MEIILISTFPKLYCYHHCKEKVKFKYECVCWIDFQRGQRTETDGNLWDGLRRRAETWKMVRNAGMRGGEGRGGEGSRRLSCSRRRSCAAARSKSRQTHSYFFSRTRLRLCIPQQLRSNKHAARGHQHTADASRRRLDLGQFLPQLSGGLARRLVMSSEQTGNLQWNQQQRGAFYWNRVYSVHSGTQQTSKTPSAVFTNSAISRSHEL